MGKLMINGEQYPAIVVKAGLDDTQTRKDATWSSNKINEELEDVRSELDIIVEEANKNTTINDEVESLTTTWSSKKTSDEIDALISDTTSSTSSTWSSSMIAQQDGVKQVFYASATSYPSIFWVLSDETTGVFWFKHTLSSSGGIQSVEGYADLTHNTVRLISGSENEINVYVGTDTTSGKKGVRFTVAWGDNATTSCKITEARPVTAIPTQIATRQHNPRQ